jgi:hypothetical protein
MDVFAIREFLLWCTIINMGLLVYWWLMFSFAHDWVMRFHGRWFTLSVEQFDGIHYAGMAAFKLMIFVFNLVPYFALLIMA